MTVPKQVKVRKLEDHHPGATRPEVFQVLAKVATTKVESKRHSKKSAAPPEPSSS